MAVDTWVETTIGEQATLQRGIDITKAEQREGNIPVISSGGISSYHDTAAVKGPGVVLGRKGVVGSVFYVEEDYWPHDTSLWVKDFHGNHPRFVYYFFKSIASQIARMDVGSANPTLNRNHVHPMPVVWPRVAEQKAIAETLGALDDKIELNRRMNETLEAIARALFRSWFVDFDPVRAKLDGRQPNGLCEDVAALFPDHFEESRLGLIPKGWRAGVLGEVIEVFDSKRIPLSGRERDQRRGSYPYYGAASVMDFVDGYLFDGIYVLMGEDGSVTNDDGTPVTQYVWGKFWVNNHAHVLQGKNGISTEHLLLHLKDSNIAAFVTGAVQAKLNQGNMNRIPFVIPPQKIGKSFAETIAPLFAKIRANRDQSATLANLRESLLPRLISGEIRIKEIV